MFRNIEEGTKGKLAPSDRLLLLKDPGAAIYSTTAEIPGLMSPLAPLSLAPLRKGKIKEQNEAGQNSNRSIKQWLLQKPSKNKDKSGLIPADTVELINCTSTSTTYKEDICLNLDIPQMDRSKNEGFSHNINDGSREQMNQLNLTTGSLNFGQRALIYREQSFSPTTTFKSSQGDHTSSTPKPATNNERTSRLQIVAQVHQVNQDDQQGTDHVWPTVKTSSTPKDIMQTSGSETLAQKGRKHSVNPQNNTALQGIKTTQRNINNNHCREFDDNSYQLNQDQDQKSNQELKPQYHQGETAINQSAFSEISKSLLNTLQTTISAFNMQSDKMDIQIDLMNMDV